VARAMGKDGRIGSKYLHPGPGYGGSCFPKDTKALAKIGRDNDEIQHIVEAAIETNEKQKLRTAKIIESVLGLLSGKTICLLGLSFKPNTDDMRESPAITICEYLAGRGAALRLYDPAAMNEAGQRLKAVEKSTYFAVDEYDAARGADALVIATEWNQFRNLDLARIKGLLAFPYFFDLRNIYNGHEVSKAGFNYFGIGIGNK